VLILYELEPVPGIIYEKKFVPNNDSSDYYMNTSYRYIGLASEIQPGESKSFSIQMRKEKASILLSLM
jgi:hypothetical protein